MLMAEGRNRQLWDHTSFLLAKLHNGLSAAKGRAKSPDDFNPYALAEKKRTQADEPTKEEVKLTFGMMKAVFVDRPVGGKQVPNRPDEATVAELRRERAAMLGTGHPAFRLGDLGAGVHRVSGEPPTDSNEGGK